MTYQQMLQLAQAAGFTGTGALVIAAIGEAESSGIPSNTHTNSDGTIDRGILQINSYWHSEVSDTCAFDPQCAFSAAYRISNNGSDFSQWATYQNGDYRQYIAGTNLLSVPVTTSSTSSTSSTTDGIFSVLTQSPFFAWITSPMRMIKMLAGLLLLVLAVIVIVAPSMLDQIQKEIT